MKKHVWIISELFYPETISTGYIMTEIAKYLSNEYNVNVITGPECYEKKDFEHKNVFLENINVNRIKSNGYNKNKVSSRIIGTLSVTIKMFLLIFKKIPKGSEILLVTNPVFLMPLVGLFVKWKKWKIKLFIHDVFPENLLITGFFNSKNNIIYRSLNSLFIYSLKKMDTIIVCGRDMKKIYEKKLNSNANIIVIENWADVEKINYRQNNLSKNNFLFAGNLGRVQGLDFIMEVIKENSDFDCDFTFIGNGAFEKNISEYINKHNLENVHLLGWQDREEQDKFLSKATVGLISLKSGMYGLGVPSKLYNLLAAGKPILYIGDVNSEIHLVLNENNIGWFVESNNKEALKKTINDIINTKPDKMKELSNNSRLLAEKKYSKQLMLKKINKLFS